MKQTVLTVILSVVFLTVCAQEYDVEIKDISSLVRVGMNPHPYDGADSLLGYTLLRALDSRNTDSLLFVKNALEKKAETDLSKEKSYGSLAFIIGKLADKNRQFDNPLSEDLFLYFTKNNCENLKKYFVLKYSLNGYKPRSVKEYISTLTFYDDLLMFNSPDRFSWDNAEGIRRAMNIKKGDKIMDIGCGFGFYSYLFSLETGGGGVVYSTDTEEDYINHLKSFLSRNSIRNIKPLKVETSGVVINDSVDFVFMNSLYHVIYTWSREDERQPFLTAIKNSLKNGGRLVIADNINLHGGELNNCHVSPELIKAQLSFWGFKPVDYKQLNGYRYLLVFEKVPDYKPDVIIRGTKNNVFRITSQKSIVHIGSLDSYDITERGIDAAKDVYAFLENGTPALADTAIKKYAELIPNENFGGEYSALQWICQAKTARPETRNEMLKDPLTKSFYETMTGDNGKVLKYYLLHKYKLGSDSVRFLSDSLLEMTGEVGRTHRSFLEDYILALNPKRTEWENTQKIIDNLGINAGDKIADIGSGSGFFSYRFSLLTGKKGKVYSSEIKDEHIEMLKKFVREQKIKNIEVIKGKEDVLELPEKVDKMFMCSLYHIFYGVSSDRERDSYLKSLARNLKDGGELIIVDNNPVEDGKLPYHGPYISPQLIEYQLEFYGFKKTNFIQVIPQRFMLKFKKVK